MKDTISTRQTSMLCIIMLFALKLLSLPSILYDGIQTDALVILFVYLVLDFLVLCGILFLKRKFPNKSFIEILSYFFGTILSKIIIFFALVFFCAKLLFLVLETYSFLRGALFEEAKLYFFLICLLPVINSLVTSKFRSMARTIEFFFIFIAIGLVICIALSVGQIDENLLKPIFDNSFKEMSSSFFKHTMWFGDFIFLFFVIDKIDRKVNYKKIVVSNLVAMVVLICFFYFYYRLYQNTSMLHLTAIVDLIQFSTKIANVGKIDIIPILVQAFVVYFQGTIFLKASKNILDSYWQKTTFNLLIINAVIVAVCYVYITNINDYTFIFNNYLSYLGVFISYLIPLIMLIIYQFKRRRNEKIV